jgi:tight adherence protein B
MVLQLVVFVLIFASIYLMLGGLYLLFFGGQMRRGRRINRRLALLQEGRDGEEVLAILRNERDGADRSERAPVIGKLAEMARHANLVLTDRALWLLLITLTALAFLFLALFTNAGPLLRIVVAPLIGYGALYSWLRSRSRRRIELIEEQLPDALDLMVRSLRVGHPINGAVGIVAREMPDPIGTEFGLLADEATYGMSINDALNKLTDRVPVPDLRFLAIAINIQSTSGGNLAEILEGLSAVIRSRFKLFRKVRAMTAEARWSGWFLSLFPIVALLVVQVIDPQYYDRVSDHPLFLPGAILTFVFLAANVFFMRVLSDIKV